MTQQNCSIFDRIRGKRDQLYPTINQISRVLKILKAYLLNIVASLRYNICFLIHKLTTIYFEISKSWYVPTPWSWSFHDPESHWCCDTPFKLIQIGDRDWDRWTPNSVRIRVFREYVRWIPWIYWVDSENIPVGFSSPQASGYLRYPVCPNRTIYLYNTRLVFYTAYIIVIEFNI